MAPNPTPPTAELGTITGRNVATTSLGSLFGQTYIDTEHVPELQHPAMYGVYDEMITDPQVRNLWLAVTTPLRRYAWTLDPNGADPAAVQALSEDLGVPIQGATSVDRPNNQSRITPAVMLRLALLGLRYGNMWTEFVGTIEDTDRGWFRLRKLAPRLPKSIMRINVAQDGNPVSLVQRSGLEPVEIPIERLLGHVWDQYPGNWFGTSFFRAAHKPWWYKQGLARVDAAKHRRNGMGVPIGVNAPMADHASIQRTLDAAKAIQAGDNSGISVPAGADIRIKGVEGSLPDTLASIRYWDEQISKVGLNQVADLGQTPNGSRALGETMADSLTGGIDAIAEYVTDPYNEVLIPRWFTWNLGSDARRPILRLVRIEDPDLVISDLGIAVDKGLLIVTPDVREAIRKQARLAPEPEGVVVPRAVAPTPVAAPVVPAPPAVAAARGGVLRRAIDRIRSVHASTTAPDHLPDRPLRRALNDAEVLAGTDFKALDEQWDSATGKIVKAWNSVRQGQIDELVGSIEGAGADLEALATIKATPAGTDMLAGAMHELATSAAAGMQAEAERQGVTLPDTSPDVYADTIAARAAATAQMLADNLSNAATSHAVRFTGGSLTPTEVAGKVREKLEGLSDAWLQDQLGGALTAAQNAGRFATADTHDGASRYYASELLDANTCDECAAVDETEFESADDAASAYPTGGYIDCAGGLRCRGTIVVVYDEATASVDGTVDEA